MPANSRSLVDSGADRCILDKRIAQKRVPPMILIMIANGGGDAQGHQRGKEYDAIEWVWKGYAPKKGK